MTTHTTGHGRPHGGNGYFPHRIWNKATNISRKPEVSGFILINCFNSCNDSLFSDMTHCTKVTEPVSLLQCHPVMCLQFTHVRSFVFRATPVLGLRLGLATFVFYCVF